MDTYQAAKIIDKIRAQEGHAFSYEYFPPRTEVGVENLIERVERMAMTDPLWIDVTWNAGGTSSDRTLELCSIIQNRFRVDVMMHMTCTYMSADKIKAALDEVSFLFSRRLSLTGQEYGTQEHIGTQRRCSSRPLHMGR